MKVFLAARDVVRHVPNDNPYIKDLEKTIDHFKNKNFEKGRLLMKFLAENN
jgi:hypothetical protein